MITTPKIPAGEARLTPVPGGLMVRARSVEEREWYPEIGDVVWDCFYAGRRREDTRTPLKVISTPALVRWGHSATGPEFGWVVVVERPKPQGWYEMDEDD